MPKFIYIFSEQDKNKLLATKYEMIKCDKDKHIYVFLNKERLDFASGDIKYALSDTLTF